MRMLFKINLWILLKISNHIYYKTSFDTFHTVIINHFIYSHDENANLLILHTFLFNLQAYFIHFTEQMWFPIKQNVNDSVQFQ